MATAKQQNAKTEDERLKGGLKAIVSDDRLFSLLLMTITTGQRKKLLTAVDLILGDPAS